MITLQKWFLLLGFISLTGFLHSDVPPLPIRGNSVIGTVESGNGSLIQLVYLCAAIDGSDRDTEYFTVVCSLRPTNSAYLLRANSDRVAFIPEESVGGDRETFFTDGNASIVEFSMFDQARLWLDFEVRYFDVFKSAPHSSFYYQARGSTNVFVGYRFSEEDGVHYGWVQFARSGTGFTNIFDLVAHDWNPIPGAAIRAGAPPEIPLVTEVVDDGAGGLMLRTSWDPGVASWIFETTDSLEPPATWTAYPAGGTSAEIPLGGADSQRYFRLRRP